MSGKKAFVIGPGFIGWNVLDLLLSDGYAVTAYVRRKEHGTQLAASGASVVIGDLEESSKITEQVLQHDITFHTATADHLPSVEAVLAGIKQRAAQGLLTTFIHTSGTSVLDDGSLSAYKSDKIYYDNKRSEIDSVPDDAPHRPIDLAIVKVQNQLRDKAKMAIMIPPLIYGFNPKHRRLTIQIPTLTRFALKHVYAAYVGKGQGVESNIHVMDLARAYLVLLHHLEKVTPKDTLENPYYFCECTGNNEPSWHEVATVIGQGLHKAGKIKDPEPRELMKDLWGDAFADFTGAVVGLNSRSRALRLRELGWKPTEKDWKSSYLEDELPEILKEEQGDFAGYKGIVPSK
ncbi:hypothetical protein AC578_6728 [Pseudocercospora eumusae]|uniref:NAD-dependent epimerase/dehydratase domain-containing protein n=1 Tax=Pseudocercospora eumusae TaxID=321146 RepID=A0A139HA57_9PEZI|nr:hypothetical protein AC578_6728 [Pseudocercospora eumusae]